MLEITDTERAYLNEMRALTTDHAGREALIGLTQRESEFYLKYSHDSAHGAHRDSGDADEYLRLHELHEQMRQAVLVGEREARQDTTPRH